MKNNSISVRAHLVNGELTEILEEASPREAIESYFVKDNGAPVQELIIKVRTRDGKMVSLYISPSRVEAAVLGTSDRMSRRLSRTYS